MAMDGLVSPASGHSAAKHPLFSIPDEQRRLRSRDEAAPVRADSENGGHRTLWEVAGTLELAKHGIVRDLEGGHHGVVTTDSEVVPIGAGLKNDLTGTEADERLAIPYVPQPTFMVRTHRQRLPGAGKGIEPREAGLTRAQDACDLPIANDRRLRLLDVPDHQSLGGPRQRIRRSRPRDSRRRRGRGGLPELHAAGVGCGDLIACGRPDESMHRLRRHAETNFFSLRETPRPQRPLGIYPGKQMLREVEIAEPEFPQRGQLGRIRPDLADEPVCLGVPQLGHGAIGEHDAGAVIVHVGKDGGVLGEQSPPNCGRVIHRRIQRGEFDDALPAAQAHMPVREAKLQITADSDGLTSEPVFAILV